MAIICVACIAILIFILVKIGEPLGERNIFGLFKSAKPTRRGRFWENEEPLQKRRRSGWKNSRENQWNLLHHRWNYLSTLTSGHGQKSSGTVFRNVMTCGLDHNVKGNMTLFQTQSELDCCGQLWVWHIVCGQTCDGLYHFTFCLKSTKSILALKLSVSATITPGGLPHGWHSYSKGTYSVNLLILEYLWNSLSDLHRVFIQNQWKDEEFLFWVIGCIVSESQLCKMAANS